MRQKKMRMYPAFSQESKGRQRASLEHEEKSRIVKRDNPNNYQGAMAHIHEMVKSKPDTRIANKPPPMALPASTPKETPLAKSPSLGEWLAKRETMESYFANSSHPEPPTVENIRKMHAARRQNALVSGQNLFDTAAQDVIGYSVTDEEVAEQVTTDTRKSNIDTDNSKQEVPLSDFSEENDLIDAMQGLRIFQGLSFGSCKDDSNSTKSSAPCTTLKIVAPTKDNTTIKLETAPVKNESSPATETKASNAPAITTANANSTRNPPHRTKLVSKISKPGTVIDDRKAVVNSDHEDGLEDIDLSNPAASVPSDNDFEMVDGKVNQTKENGRPGLFGRFPCGGKK
ncbi:hypothetical protein N0V90_010953 [Kalmusia sp. IMI 367209]|nr:hypothetical protein N0V90_010953 [Kalmusia sp. IMI 367209]